MMKKPWVEVARPVGLNDVIFSDTATEKTFRRYVAERNIPNLLFYGGPGTGKTSLSSALLRDLNIDSLDRLRINCSDEKIDALRDKVKSFVVTMPFGDAGLKVVQLEEFDHLSLDGQALLRSLIEECSATCRFIATCNYVNKVTPPLRSRFQEFAIMAPNRDQVLIRCAEILDKCDITFELDDLENVVSAAYPDFRKVIQLLEQFSTSGKLVISSAEGTADWKLELLPLLDTGDFKAARKLVCERATKEELVDVYRFLYDNVNCIKPLKGKWDEAVVLVAQYQYQHAFVGDPEIQVAALFIELGAL